MQLTLSYQRLADDVFGGDVPEDFPMKDVRKIRQVFMDKMEQSILD
jgi:hypothetical protein